MRSVTLGFGPHRIEMLDLMEEKMREHKVVVLEEPPHPDFYGLLQGEVDMRHYLAKGSFQFPRFVRRACRRYQRLYQEKKIAFFQVDPYLSVVQNLTTGKPPRTELEEQIWECEHRAVSALLAYYEAVATNDFDAMVKATQNFARTDAARIRLRDELRVEEILRVIIDTEGDVYIEAGYIHLCLYPLLRRKLPPDAKPRILFLAQKAIRQRTNLPWRQPLSPGDVLTLRYLNGRPETPGDALLAAQSLIYVSLVAKEEKLPTAADPFPHLSEELYLCRWVRKLSYEECAAFYRQVRQRKRP